MSSSSSSMQRAQSYGEGKPVTDSEALYQFRLLEALRSGEIVKLQPFLNDLTRSAGVGEEDKGAAMLNRAVKCASYETVELILSNRAVDPNAPYPSDSGVTPLHLAAELGRADLVKLLLDQPSIDDTLLDSSSRSILNAATSQEVQDVITASRQILQTRFLKLLSEYTNAPSTAKKAEDGGRDGEANKLLALLKNPRAGVLDLNALDASKGVSALHEAVRRKDLVLVKYLVLERNADVFVRDRRGGRVLDNLAPGDHVTNLLKQASNNQKALAQRKGDGSPVAQRGYLLKYTNVAHGYKNRWFVIDDGVLSYFRNQEEENKACRGSVSLKFAHLKPTSSTSFDIQPATHDSRFPKYSLRASHPQEAAIWSQTIEQHIKYYGLAPDAKDEEATKTRHSLSIKRLANRKSNANLAQEPSSDTPLPPIPGALGVPADGKAPRTSMSRPPSFMAAKPTAPFPQGSGIPSQPRTVYTRRSSSTNVSVDETVDDDFEASPSISQGPLKSVAHVSIPGIPYQDRYEILANSTRQHLEVTDQLLDSLVISSSASSTKGLSTAPPMSSSPSKQALARTLSTTSSRQQTVKDSLRQSLKVLADLTIEYQHMSSERERWLVARYQHEVDTRRLWEESMQDVAKEQAALESQLREAGEENRRHIKEIKAVKLLSPGYAGSPNTIGVAGASPFGGQPQSVLAPKDGEPTTLSSLRAPGKDLPAVPTTVDPQNPEVKLSLPEADRVVGAAAVDSDEEDEDDDDEFYDAIEAGNLPLQISSSFKPQLPESSADEETGKPAPAYEEPAPTSKLDLDAAPYEPYKHLRKKLPISDDQRPAISLWSILKSSIGKDLTKISFPVSFNECTSMLQRMAEDMEYSECLDAAASEPDSLKRIAYVAAFAMSNYSSTVGRIAKPFNPMLGETFEYTRPDKQFNYVSEQVSHHPPMSACMAESPRWRYYGEVDAKNKFTGKSFEIRPTGGAHCDLSIPREWATGKGYEPDNLLPEGDDSRVLEHFSWKKVTTGVTNFILGNPIIDHYGDMEVKNHRTGETCVLSFKPRGWRAKDSFEIKGMVKDARGSVKWDIAGRWNSQLVARQSGVGHGSLEPDANLPTTGGSATTPHIAPEYLLLWKNTVKPLAPFNLTPFAITLNDLPQDLADWVAPTDCRMRPDQRAFELAKYERANDLKQEQENKQRQIRKQRETGQLPPHSPRWFTSAIDEDTGERVWHPKRTPDGEIEYWAERVKAHESGGKWENVDDIFIHVDLE